MRPHQGFVTDFSAISLICGVSNPFSQPPLQIIDAAASKICYRLLGDLIDFNVF